MRERNGAPMSQNLVKARKRNFQHLAPVPLSAVCFRHRAKDNRRTKEENVRAIVSEVVAAFRELNE